MLSYAGRLQLIKSVLFGIQLYWCQIFVMPKKVLKEIQRICRVFLWIGQDVIQIPRKHQFHGHRCVYLKV